MTAAFNLSQLANNLNSSGQLDATDGLSGLVANANLASSGTADSTTFLRGDRTWQALSQKIINIEQVVNGTRAAVSVNSGTTRTTLISFPYTKQQAGSSLIFMAAIAGFGNNSGSVALVATYGSSGEFGSLFYPYTGQPYPYGLFANGTLTGWTTTGSQNFSVKYFDNNGASGDKPFNYLNPNSTDDPRMNQYSSILTVVEYV